MKPNRDLKLCSARGHVFGLPTDNPELLEKLIGSSNNIPTYRCLRCGDYTLLDSKPTEYLTKEIPLVPRGSHNRKLYSLKFIAMERWIRASVIVAVALGLFRLTAKNNNFYTSFTELTKAFKPFADKIGFNLTQSHTLHLIESMLKWSHTRYFTVASLLFLYALLQIFEGYGLWIGARWGEYLAAIVTGAFIPLEIYEVSTHATILKIIALGVNLAIALYLTLKERLFGIRGGHKAYQADLYSTSLIAKLDSRSPSD